MPGTRKRLVIGLLAMALFALAALACDGDEVSPWLYCTTNPCQPLALLALPTPPALSDDASLAATCELVGDEGGEGILLWHTDWDPLTQEGLCATREEARDLGADIH